MAKSVAEARADPHYQGIATQKGYDQSYSRVEKVKYSHEAMIDMILTNPKITQNELATAFGYSVPWISRIIGSDAFQAALAVRRDQFAAPVIMGMEEKLRGMANQSIDIIIDKLEATKNADLAMEALELSTKALGFGARTAGSGNVQNNFVVQLPPVAPSAEAWAAAHAGGLKPAKPSEALPISTTISRDPTVQPAEMTAAEDQA